jgi:hypothetical protein
MEENEFLEIAAGKKRLLDFFTPFVRRTDLVEVSREIDINMPGTGPFASGNEPKLSAERVCSSPNLSNSARYAAS